MRVCQLLRLDKTASPHPGTPQVSSLITGIFTTSQILLPHWRQTPGRTPSHSNALPVPNQSAPLSNTSNARCFQRLMVSGFCVSFHLTLCWAFRTVCDNFRIRPSHSPWPHVLFLFLAMVYGLCNLAPERMYVATSVSVLHLLMFQSMSFELLPGALSSLSRPHGEAIIQSSEDVCCLLFLPTLTLT